MILTLETKRFQLRFNWTGLAFFWNVKDSFPRAVKVYWWDHPRIIIDFWDTPAIIFGRSYSGWRWK